MRTSGFQKATPMIGLTMRIPLSRNSRSFASCVAPRQLASVLYAFSTPIRYGSLMPFRYSLISVRPPNASTNSWSSHGL